MSSTTELLFLEEDFELEHFDDAEFVAKYRKVITLESLREQLVEYSGNVRNELYAIINRDYKDFITISTKLDGLDTRLELIQKPLFDLQMNVSSLHNCVTSSLRSIKDKISHQSSIAEQKTRIEQLIEAIDNLKVVQDAIRGDSNGGESSRSLRAQFYRDGTLPSLSAKENHSELFSCLEYERMATALAVTLRCLQSIDSGKGIAELGVLINLKDLQDEASSLKKALEEKMTSHIEMSFMNAYKTHRSDEPSSSEPSVQRSGLRLFSTEMRCFLHCVRGLKLLKAERRVEQVFVRAVTEPFMKLSRANLTYGKIDGKEGRGSFSGLADTLNSFVQLLQRSKLVDIFDALEDASLVMVDFDRVDANDSVLPVDLIVNGIWKPFAHVFMERFGNMFSIGIPAIFSRCFLSFDEFFGALSSHLVSPISSLSTLQRLLSTEVTSAFLQMWKLDTYSQLLFREICQRIDKVCDSSLRSKFGLKGGGTSAASSVRVLVDQLYAVVMKAGMTSSTSNLSLSLDPSQISYVASAFQSFTAKHNKLFNEYVIAFVSELLVLVNRSVMLQPLYGKFLLLIDRLVMRLLLHLSVVLVSDSTTTFCQRAFNLTKADVDSLRASQIGKQGDASVIVEGGSVPTSTVDEQIITATDLLSFVKWFVDDYPDYLLSNSTVSTASSASSSQFQEAWEQLVRKSIITSSQSLVGFLKVTYRQIVSDITVECMKSLSNVKAIAGKYRMTNKPAPTDPSPYVALIFAPFKKLLDSYSSSLILLSSHLGASTLTMEDHSELHQQLRLFDSSVEEVEMKLHIIQAVTQAFHDQVLSLLATVKQMDSALQRRAIKPRSALGGDTASSLSDSEKIALQLKLDVERYGMEITQLGIDCTKASSYEKLLQEVQNIDVNK